jgi:nitroimidazol reductase NimA-like FMN-containing flavoprotein (pyridoxamine 5'-phosphate oxidase superfamily)
MGKIIRDQGTIEEIIRSANVCRVGLCDRGQPYVVPVSFGYEDHTVYFHSSLRGRKMDVLRENSAVCVEFDVDGAVVQADSPCKWNLEYRSVIGFGKAIVIESLEEKRAALDVIVRHYGGEPGGYAEGTLRKTAVVKVEIESMTGKTSAS